MAEAGRVPAVPTHGSAAARVTALGVLLPHASRRGGEEDVRDFIVRLACSDRSLTLRLGAHPPLVQLHKFPDKPAKPHRLSMTPASVIHDTTVGHPQQHRRSSTTAPSVIHDSTVGHPQQHRRSSTTAPSVIHNTHRRSSTTHRRSSTTATSVNYEAAVGRDDISVGHPRPQRRPSTTATSVIHDSTVGRR